MSKAGLLDPSTPSARINSKIRGRKIELSENDETLISTALSVIWTKTHKKVESCLFESDKVKVSYIKHEGRLYFDLFEQEFIPDIKRFQEELGNNKRQDELENRKLENDKRLQEELENNRRLQEELENSKKQLRLLESELQSLRPLQNPICDTTMDTIVSDELDELEDPELSNYIMECSTPPPALYPESSASTPSSIFCENDSELALARLVNCDLAMNNLTTSDTPGEIWSSLHKRCVDKFGDQDNLKDNSTSDDVDWACVILQAYLRWSNMEEYHNDINKWIIKINAFRGRESDAVESTPPQEASTATSAATSPRSRAILTSTSATSKFSVDSSENSSKGGKHKHEYKGEKETRKINNCTDDCIYISSEESDAINDGNVPLPRSFEASTFSIAAVPKLPENLTNTNASRKRDKRASRKINNRTNDITNDNIPPPRLPAASTSSRVATVSEFPENLTNVNALHKRDKRASRKIDNSEEEDIMDNVIDDNSTLSPEVQAPTSLTPAQKLLLKKGKKLREILLNPTYNDNDSLTISKESKSQLMNALTELSAESIKITDEKSAAERIQQWKHQESQCAKFLIAAESYNICHLMSLVGVYEDLLRVGEDLKKEGKVKNVKSWAMRFMCKNLNIGQKMEQRNRLGCNRLRRLFKEGVTSEQLVNAGCKKCDFFAKQEDYDIFVSQIPSLETRRSISVSTNESRVSEILCNKAFEDDSAKNSTRGKGKNRVMFRLHLRDDFEDAEKYNDEYIYVK